MTYTEWYECIFLILQNWCPGINQTCTPWHSTWLSSTSPLSARLLSGLAAPGVSVGHQGLKSLETQTLECRGVLGYSVRWTKVSITIYIAFWWAVKTGGAVFPYLLQDPWWLPLGSSCHWGAISANGPSRTPQNVSQNYRIIPSWNSLPQGCTEQSPCI